MGKIMMLPWSCFSSLPRTTQHDIYQYWVFFQQPSCFTGSLPTLHQPCFPSSISQILKNQLPQQIIFSTFTSFCYYMTGTQNGKETLKVFAKWSSFFLSILSFLSAPSLPLPLEGLYWPHWLPGISAYQQISHLYTLDIY